MWHSHKYDNVSDELGGHVAKENWWITNAEIPLSEQFMVVIRLQVMTNMGVISPDKPTKILDSVRLNAPDYFVVKVF